MKIVLQILSLDFESTLVLYPLYRPAQHVLVLHVFPMYIFYTANNIILPFQKYKIAMKFNYKKLYFIWQIKPSYSSPNTVPNSNKNLHLIRQAKQSKTTTTTKETIVAYLYHMFKKIIAMRLKYYVSSRIEIIIKQKSINFESFWISWF